jgi:Ca2+-binding RTX toxin-like protein
MVVLMTGAMPSAASARARVEVTQDLVLQVTADTNDDTLRLFQDDDVARLRISVESTDGVDVDAGGACTSLFGPTPTARCSTAGVTAISIQLSPPARGAPEGPEANRVDLTAVTQLVPDGSAPLPVGVSGGPGADRVVDGAGRMGAFTGPGNDFVDAGAGNDDVDEGPGNDIVLAGEGDDRFGDFQTQHSDILSGGPGRDQVNARGTVTLDDLLCNDGAASDAPTPPFGVARTVGAPEGTLECPGTTADRDLITGIEAVSSAFNEAPVDFTGSNADEFLFGERGPDRLEGGGGRDTLVSSSGNDLLLARDQGEDARIDCGEIAPDDDVAVVDQVDPVEPNCETIERGQAELAGPVGGGAEVPPFQGFPPPPPPSPPQGDQPSSGSEGNGAGGGDNGQTPPRVEIPTRVAFVRRGRIRIRVRCVYRAQNCVGRLTLTAAQNRRAGRRRVRRGQRLASGRVSVPWGTSRATTLRAPGSLTALLRALDARALKVRALVQVRDGAAPRTARSARASRVVTLGLQR